MAKPRGDFFDDSEVVDRNRIMRERARWRGLEELTTLAKIEVLEHGGRARPIINRGGRHLRSRLVSRKTNLVQVTEGKGLKFLCMTCEISSHIPDYQAHPFRVTAAIDGVLCEWYPDLIYILSDGTIEIIEVKRSIADLRKAGYYEKLTGFREIFRRCGWRMRILYDKDVFGVDETRAIRRTNVHAIYGRRYLTTSADEKRRLTELTKTKSQVTWQKVAKLLSPKDGLRGNALVEHAVARCCLSADFDQPLGPSTLLTPVASGRAVGTIRI